MNDRPASARRFTDRASDYARWRPGYPSAVVTAIQDVSGLAPGWSVADIGSGTGISAKLFLDFGCTVFGVEPNEAMRGVAEERLGYESGFHSVDGTAEATTLADASVDLVTAAQAFHWFDRPAARREFARILRPPGWVAIIFNERLTDTTFLHAYEALLHAHAEDYAYVDHRRVTEEMLRAFFGGPFDSRSMPNQQDFEFRLRRVEGAAAVVVLRAGGGAPAPHADAGGAARPIRAAPAGRAGAVPVRDAGARGAAGVNRVTAGSPRRREESRRSAVVDSAPAVCRISCEIALPS